MSASVRIVMVALLLQACAEAKPVGPAPASEAAQQLQQPAQPDAALTREVAQEPQQPALPDAATAREVAQEPQQPALPDAATADAGAVPPAGPGREAAAQVQACPEGSAFTPLSSLLEKPVAGLVAVRGRVWGPAVVRCTAAIPEHCFGNPMLARSKPIERTNGQIVLTGRLSDSTPLVCSGRRRELRCPFPAEGQEYGVTGLLTVEGEGDERSMSIALGGICRI